MEGNDLANDYSRCIVVVLEPLIVSAPPAGQPKRRGLLRRPVPIEETLGQWSFNETMCLWIADRARRTNVPIDIWSFLPEEQFDFFVPWVEEVCYPYVRSFERWESVRRAYTHLLVNQNVETVYDGDHDRVDMWWKFRGCRVLLGGTP
jgi:hypothetical protein